MYMYIHNNYYVSYTCMCTCTYTVQYSHCEHMQFGDTPLVAAAGAGQVETVRLLLDRGANPETPGLRVRDV